VQVISEVFTLDQLWLGVGVTKDLIDPKYCFFLISSPDALELGTQLTNGTKFGLVVSAGAFKIFRVKELIQISHGGEHVDYLHLGVQEVHDGLK